MTSVTHLLDQPGRSVGASLQHLVRPAWVSSTHCHCNVFFWVAPGRRAWRRERMFVGGTTSAAATPACSSATPDMLIQRAAEQPHARPSWQHLPGSPRGYRCRLCLEVDFATRGHLAEHLVRAMCSPNFGSHASAVKAWTCEHVAVPVHLGGQEAPACRAARRVPLLRADLRRQGQAAGACPARLRRAGAGLHPRRPDPAHAPGGLRPRPLLRPALPGVHGRSCRGLRRRLGTGPCHTAGNTQLLCTRPAVPQHVDVHSSGCCTRTMLERMSTEGPKRRCAALARPSWTWAG